ncbi:hypothetical protein predicted by Glimmer/Critica [Acetobacter ghanensis]|uniref:Uncharacterized protein n=1 Tax=Acetobacter ghanensis TaxID=431306 RepID=A0A0U5G0Q4_9PROT|nr:hypothetical protein predicted by Glimmer/Critica [Acetobacter ghanensis]
MKKPTLLRVRTPQANGEPCGPGAVARNRMVRTMKTDKTV